MPRLYLFSRALPNRPRSTVRAWCPGTRKPVPLFRSYGKGVGHHAKGVKCVDVFVAASGARISASGGEDNTVKCWDPLALGLEPGQAAAPLPPRRPAPEPSGDRPSLAALAGAKREARDLKRRQLLRAQESSRAGAGGAGAAPVEAGAPAPGRPAPPQLPRI